MKKILVFSLMLILMLCGCSKTNNSSDSIEGSFGNDCNTAAQDNKNCPSKLDVENARKIYLECMNDEEIENLTMWIAEQNLLMEQTYVYRNKFEQFKNPDALIWNLYEETGEEVLIGYAYDEDEKGKTHSEMSADEYMRLYGSPVVAENRMNADSYISKLEEFKLTIHNEDFLETFDRLIDYYSLARETHDVKYILSIYYIYHDMDYYLLRYAPETFKDAAIIDKSTINTYYGTFDIY